LWPLRQQADHNMRLGFGGGGRGGGQRARIGQ